jgi:hypothetical protein
LVKIKRSNDGAAKLDHFKLRNDGRWPRVADLSLEVIFIAWLLRLAVSFRRCVIRVDIDNNSSRPIMLRFSDEIQSSNRTDCEMKHNERMYSSLIPYHTEIETITAPIITSLLNIRRRLRQQVGIFETIGNRANKKRKGRVACIIGPSVKLILVEFMWGDETRSVREALSIFRDVFWIFWGTLELQIVFPSEVKIERP